jgi:hypothetical protein
VSDLSFLRDRLETVGWFIPPYVRLGSLGHIAKRIRDEASFNQEDLEDELGQIYTPGVLAAMVCERYPRVPTVQHYKMTIAEAIEAHFLGLDHVAVGGLVPVIEGIGRRLVAARSLVAPHIRDVFKVLAEDCIREATALNLGAVGEVVSMLRSFATFTGDYLYTSSNAYLLADKTNRHGISHGTFADIDYGRPLNFYKVIASVDFLTFVASFRAPISWFAPDPTEASTRRARYYLALTRIRGFRPAAT